MLKIISKNINFVLKEKSNLASSIRFIIVGTVATGIHYGAYLLLLNIASKNIAYSIGYVLSFGINFYLTSLFTFKSDLSVKKGIGFFMSHLLNYGLQMLVFNFYLSLNFQKEIVPILVFMTTIPINFFIIKLVFNKLK
jgi:putative flippase GtrA